MANATIAQAITRSNVEQAYIQSLSELSADETSYRDKLVRAYSLLIGTVWYFDGETLNIASGSSTKRYTVSHNHCECKAYARNFMCYHRVARRLLIKAGELATQPEAILSQRVAATPADIDFSQDDSLPDDLNIRIAKALDAYDCLGDAPLMPVCQGCGIYLTGTEFNYCHRCVTYRVEELF